MDFEKKVIEIDINDILPNRFQPRLRFSEESINELALSIKEHGVIQPIVVRKIDDKFEIIAGERRYKASLIAGNKKIPAIVTDLNDKDSAEVALIENVQRKDLTPIEEAISYKKILDMGYMTQDDLATKLGKTQSTVANKLRLLNLTEETQEALLDEKISERHARSLLKLTNQNSQLQMLNRVINERMTVRKTDEEIDKMINESREIVDFPQPTTILNNNTVPADIIDEVVEEIPGNPIFGDQNTLPVTPPVATEVKTPELSTPIDSFDSIFNPVNSGEVKVEELNIPTMPIEEEEIVPSIVNIDAIKENSFTNLFGSIKNEEPALSEAVVEKASIDPGFMDIEKIQSEATDIFQTKQTPNMTNLLEPTEVESIFPDVVLNPTPVEEKEETIVPGKFFNMISEEYNDEEDEDVSIQNLNSFNFNFDEIEDKRENIITEEVKTDNPMTSIPVESVENEVVNPLTSIAESNVFDVFNLNPINHEERNKIIEEKKIENNNAENINPIFNSEPILFNEPIIEPVPAVEEKIESAIETPSFQPVQPFENIQMFETAVQPVIESEPILEDIAESVIESQPATALTKNFKDALNAIRECNAKIEKMGFDIDTEEFDFEDIYQVIFKINK